MKKIDNYFIYTNDFIERYRLELKSETTISTYLEGLNSFRRFLCDSLNIRLECITFKLITSDVVRKYTKWLNDSGYSINTRNSRLTTIKQYSRFCAEKRPEFLSTYLDISNIKTKHSTPKTNNWLSKDQVILILQQPSRNKIGIRDRFIMLFLFSTGARLSELLAIKVSDIKLNTTSPHVVLMGKGNKQRLVPLSKETSSNCENYLNLFHQNCLDGQHLLYVSLKGEKSPMSPDNVQRIVNKYSALARKQDKTIPKVHPHTFRHSFAALMYRQGMSLPELSKLLGHSDLSTTEIYAETDYEMICDAVAKITNNDVPNKWESLDEDEKLRILGLKR